MGLLAASALAQATTKAEDNEEADAEHHWKHRKHHGGEGPHNKDYPTSNANIIPFNRKCVCRRAACRACVAHAARCAVLCCVRAGGAVASGGTLRTLCACACVCVCAWQQHACRHASRLMATGSALQRSAAPPQQPTNRRRVGPERPGCGSAARQPCMRLLRLLLAPVAHCHQQQALPRRCRHVTLAPASHLAHSPPPPPRSPSPATHTHTHTQRDEPRR
jgi:hypothetical protein